MNKMINQKPGIQSIAGPSQKPLRYANTSKYASLHGLQMGAEFNEEPIPMTFVPSDCPDDFFAQNIRSGCNRTDLPSAWGFRGGMDKIGNLTFTPDSICSGWVRNKGEW